MTKIIRAEPDDAGVLSAVIAEAFFDLPPSRWLISDEASRHKIFPAYFRIFVEHALAQGIVHTTPDRAAAALWLPGRRKAATVARPIRRATAGGDRAVDDAVHRVRRRARHPSPDRDRPPTGQHALPQVPQHPADLVRHFQQT